MQSKVGGLKQFSKVLAQVQKAAGKTNVNMSVRCSFGITQASRARVFFFSRVFGLVVRDATLLRPLVDSICAENLIRRAVDMLDM